MVKQIITLSVNGLSTTSVILKSDRKLVAFVTTGASVALSFDPSLVRADLSGPAATLERDNVLGYASGTPLYLNLQLFKGQQIFAAFSGAGSCFLYFE